MKKWIAGLLLIGLLLISLVNAEVRINEVELNPYGSDTGNEWIELYSDSLINLESWKLVNTDNEIIPLNQSFSGYKIINLEEQWLDNENESVILYNGDSLISITPVLRDNNNDNRTWNYCNGVWLFLSSTPGLINACSQSNNQSDNTNQTNPNFNNTNNSSNLEISLILDWDDEDIVNGKTFEITIKAENLENKNYDIKVGIYDEDNRLISQTYDENEKWVSSSEYYNEFFSGSGSVEEHIKLRIKESYRDFKGDAVIIVRLRETGSAVYKKEKKEDIEILKNRINEDGNQENLISNGPEIINKQEAKIIESENIIYLTKSKNLETESIKTNKNTIYKSKNELIKTYSIYFFAFLLVVLCVLLVFIRI